MLSYPYIEAVFKSILKQSKVIQGRFHTCPHFGGELNTSNLSDVLDVSLGDYKRKEYPLVIMLPPRSMGDYTEVHLKDEYQIILYFLTATFRTTKNQIKSINPDLLVSTHRIMYDWHDMKRCAVSFLKVAQDIGIGSNFHISERERQVIDPITKIGNDGVSGVLVSFQLNLDETCELEDYPSDYDSKILLPDATDLHPEHLH